MSGQVDALLGESLDESGTMVFIYFSEDYQCMYTFLQIHNILL